MTLYEVTSMLAEIGLPVAYDHYAEGESPSPPFLVYLYPSTDHFAADGGIYSKINVLHIELYTDLKSPEIEDRVEAVLDEYGFFYSKTETWIADEKLYEVLYTMEVLITRWVTK